MQCGECPTIEAGSDLPDVMQSTPVIGTQQQSAKMLPRAGRLRVPGNHELILLMDLYFKPSGCARFHVRTGRILCHQSLVSLAFRDAKGLETVGCESVRPHERLARADRPHHHSASRGERFTPQILTIVKKAIKDGIHRFALVLLKELKSGNTLFVKYHNFTIEKERGGAERSDSRCNPREADRAVFSVSG